MHHSSSSSSRYFTEWKTKLELKRIDFSAVEVELKVELFFEPEMNLTLF